MKPNVIRIEKHIPMPKMRHTGSSKYQFLKKLEVGDSFVIDSSSPDYSPKQALSSIYSYAHVLRRKGGMYRNFKVAIRTLTGSFERPLSIRIWRVQ